MCCFLCSVLLLPGPVSHLLPDEFANAVPGNVLPEEDASTDPLVVSHLLVHKLNELLLSGLKNMNYL